MKKVPDVLAQYAQAVDSLFRALKEPASSELSIDGTIQRFEFCFELAWKAMQALLVRYGQKDVNSPRPVLQKAFREGWLANEETWVVMLQDRNLTSHTYNRDLAEQIYSRIPTHAKALKDLQQHLVDASKRSVFD